MESALHQQGTLQPKGSNKEIEAHSAEAVVFQKGHCVARTQKHPDMHTLETCPTKRWSMQGIAVSSKTSSNQLKKSLKINVQSEDTCLSEGCFSRC